LASTSSIAEKLYSSLAQNGNELKIGLAYFANSLDPI
jgi:hypothetical protein